MVEKIKCCESKSNQVLEKQVCEYARGVVSKTYGQYCGIAAALDRVGDRWTLLVLRELSFGERRFTDLKAALPGIATNLLTDRLRALEADGLVEQREIPPPVSRTVYALSEEGRAVRPVLTALFRFGERYLDEPSADTRVRPELAVHGVLASRFASAAHEGGDVVVRFDLDGTQLGLAIAGGQLRRPPAGATADVTVQGSAAALVRLCRGTATRRQLSEALRIEGSAAARRTFLAAFDLR